MAAKLVMCHRPMRLAEQWTFQAAWKGQVGPQVCALQQDLGFVRYAQTHAVAPTHPWGRIFALTRTRGAAALLSSSAPGKGYQPGDRGLAALARTERWSVLEELWWPSVDGMLAAVTSASGLAALNAMRGLYASHGGHRAVVVCREHIIAAPREERPDAVRIGFCLRPRARDTPHEMQAYWGDTHATLVRSLTEQLRFDQYDRAPVVLDDPRADRVIDVLGGPQAHPYVGIASLSYPSLRNIILRFLRPAAQIANLRLMQDELAFIDPPACPPVLGRRVPFA